MKVVLLAGGFGTRISEESQFKPKPMVEIGEKPILWHIMKEYAYYGFNEFIVCAGYKQHVIKEWFAVVISAILILCMKEREATQTKKKAKKVAPKKGW